MNVKRIVKYLELKSQLSPEELQMAESIVSWTESEKEALVGLLRPVKVIVKATRNVEKCADPEGCGLTRRAACHKDTSRDDYHEFQLSSKSQRASGMAAQLNKNLKKSKELYCVACHEFKDHANHDLDNGGHVFDTNLSARIASGLAKHELVDRDDEKCASCGRDADENIHHLATCQGYHEFTSSVAQAASGD